MLDSDLLNLPFEWVEGVENRWAKAILTLVSVVLWVIPLLLVFVTPLLVWNALYRD